MNGDSETDWSFLYLEEHNFLSWYIQFKAMLREFDCDEIVETQIPKDVNANEVPMPMNARERQQFNCQLRDCQNESLPSKSNVQDSLRKRKQTSPTSYTSTSKAHP
jgi:hypothetical protein